MTDGPLDERCPDCGALVDACRCPDVWDVWDDERYLNGDDTCPRCGGYHSWCQSVRSDEF